MKQTLIYFWHKLSSRAFWRDNWRSAAVIAGGTAAIILIIGLLVGGQRDIGAREAGEQIVRLAQNIRSRYQARPDFWGLSTAEVIRQKIYPLSMKVEDTKLLGYFGNEVEVGSDAAGTPVMPTMRSFVIAYNGLNKQQCTALAANKFSQNFWLGVEGLTIANDKETRLFDWSSKELVLPADDKVVKNYCQRNNNSVIFHFK